jgi:hypothetical protein
MERWVIFSRAIIPSREKQAINDSAFNKKAEALASAFLLIFQKTLYQ